MASNHGEYWQNQPEAIAVCMRCEKPDCDSSSGCEALKRVIRQLRRERRVERGVMVEVAGRRMNVTQWARLLGVDRGVIYECVRAGEEPKAVIWRMCRRKGWRGEEKED